MEFLELGRGHPLAFLRPTRRLEHGGAGTGRQGEDEAERLAYGHWVLPLGSLSEAVPRRGNRRQAGSWSMQVCLSYRNPTRLGQGFLISQSGCLGGVL